MNEHTLELLQFEEIRDELREYCITAEGRELISEQQILTTIDGIDEFHNAIEEFRRIEASDVSAPELIFPHVQDVFPVLEKEGTILEIEQLTAVALYARSSQRLALYLKKIPYEGTDIPALSQAGLQIPDLSALSKALLSVVTEDGKMRDTLPSLRAIRKRIQGIHADIESMSTRYLQDNASYFQTDTPTQKEGRTVLPLKSSHRSKVDGIVHDVSATGATLFIEPFDIVQKNNDLVQQENEYRQEVLRILKEKTAEVRVSLGELFAAVGIVSRIDTMWARAKYSFRHKCHKAIYRPRAVSLVKARHPLLGRTAVPIDISAEEGIRSVIISGPNAGGKTVTLKTVGLLAAMNQFGMEIPAADDSVLGVFDKIYADIGDEQSIDDSLSTFSGHMKNVSEILIGSTEESLVFLDELGGGTDPEEGAALAMAVLDDLIGKGALVFVSSHTGALKNYAFSTEGVVNASVDFDETTLSPTYRIVAGLPGESHALDIALRSGIDKAVVDHALGYMSEESADVAAIISELSSRMRDLEAERNELKRHEHELVEIQRENDLRILRMRQREAELKQLEQGELSRYVKESRKRLENLVRELREGELTRQKTKKVKTVIAEMSGELDRHSKETEELSRELSTGFVAEDADGEIVEGADVYVGKGRKDGTVIRHEKNGKWLVAVNNLRMTVAEEELVLRKANAPKNVTPRQSDVSVAMSSVSSGERPELELDIRGMRMDEALRELEIQLDRALMHGMQQFSVIHGMGEGILRKGVHDFLKRSLSVSRFEFSRPEEGGFGKTIVFLT